MPPPRPRQLDDDAAIERLQQRHGLDDLAAETLLSYLTDQAEATGAVPDDRTIVVERFRDEIEVRSTKLQEPPPPKDRRALPVPPESSGKRRGGRRLCLWRRRWR